MRDDAVALLACLLSGFLLTLALPPNGWWKKTQKKKARPRKKAKRNKQKQ